MKRAKSYNVYRSALDCNGDLIWKFIEEIKGTKKSRHELVKRIVTSTHMGEWHRTSGLYGYEYEYRTTIGAYYRFSPTIGEVSKLKPVKIIESKRWVNSETGTTASIYGAVPYSNEVDKAFWSIQVVGYTFAMSNGTVGFGRPPFKTLDEAQTAFNEWNAK